MRFLYVKWCHSRPACLMPLHTHTQCTVKDTHTRTEIYAHTHTHDVRMHTHPTVSKISIEKHVLVLSDAMVLWVYVNRL